MTPTVPRTASPRWALTVALVVVSLIIAGCVGFAAILVGSDFMASNTAKPVPSFMLWIVAGAALAAPVAALPTLGFSVRPQVSWLFAAALAAAVVLVGFFGLTHP